MHRFMHKFYAIQELKMKSEVCTHKYVKRLHDDTLPFHLINSANLIGPLLMRPKYLSGVSKVLYLRLIGSFSRRKESVHSRHRVGS